MKIEHLPDDPTSPNRKICTVPNPSRVLHVGWGHPPNMAAGPIYYLHQLCLEQRSTGLHPTCFVASNDQGDANQKPSLSQAVADDIPYHVVGNRSAHYFDWSNPLRETQNADIEALFQSVLREAKPEMVHFHNLIGLSMSLPEIAKLNGCMTLLSAHNYWMVCPRDDLFTADERICTGPGNGARCAHCTGTHEKIEEFIARTERSRKILNRSVDRILAVSKRVEEIFLSCGAPAEKIRVVRIGSRAAEFNWKMTGIRKTRDVSVHEKITFAFFGSLLVRKGVHVVLEAAERLERFKDEFVVEVYGGGLREPYRKRLIDILRRSPFLQQIVVFKNQYHQNDMPALLRGIDIAIIPPVWEDNGPQTAMEVLGGGVPVIGSRIGGIPDLVIDQSNGLLFQAGDPADLAGAMQKVLCDKGLISRLRQGIDKPFTMAHHASELQNIYVELATDSNPAKDSISKVMEDKSLILGAKGPFATIIIPVFNQIAYTVRCIDSLYRSTPLDLIHQVVVVDNASSDGTIRFLEEAQARFPKLTVLTNPENLFFARACNQGADLAKSPYLVFLNNDTEPLEGWLEPILERFRNDDSVGVVGSKLIYPDGTIQHAGIEFFPTKGGMFACWPSHRFRHRPGDHPDANRAAEVPAVTGACLAIDRELFRSIGGFSCDYKMYFEDLDLNFKVRRAGKRIYYEPASVVVHHEGKSSPGQQDIDRLNLRSAELFFSTWKNFFEIQPNAAAASEKPSIVWLAPLFNPSGYCSEAMAFIQGLANKARLEIGNISNIYSKNFVEGLTPEIQQLLKNLYRERIDFGNKIAVMHFPGYSFSKNSEAVYTIGRTMFETDSLPADWVDKCNQMDEIWVPSKFNLETFARAGVKKEKLLLIPEPVDTQFFSPENARTDPNKNTAGYKFLSIFEWSARKGWDVLLEAYFREFSRADNVSLTIKTYLLHAPDGDADAKIRDTIRSFESSLELNIDELPSIEIITRQLDYRELPSFYAAFDCVVIPSRGEGWGRPYCEAMSMGLPVIATNWSGNTEFMNAGNSFLVRVEGLKEIESSEIGFYKGHKWAQPSVEHLRELMRQLYNDPDLGKAKGLQARQDMVRYYSCDIVGDRARDRLSEVRDALAHRRHAVRQASQKVDRAHTHLHISWEGAQFVTHSLALVNRELCLRLIENGCQVSIIPIERDAEALGKEPRFKPIVERIKTAGSLNADVHVRHQWPPNFDPPRAGYWVMIQPWEFGSIPKEWVQPMSESVDEVWAPSRYVRDCYIASGIPTDRVYVVPNGVDTKRFHPGAAAYPLRTQKTFKFLFVGGTIKRKGIDVLLDAYASAFSYRDDVCLVIKDMGGDSFYKGQTAADLIEHYRSMPETPEIEHIDRSLSETEIAGLYTACNCLVHPYRGEGFGLPIAEAMASQLPVIVTGYGAALDFCTEENSYMVPVKIIAFTDKKVGQIETVDYPWLVEPEREALKSFMRRVVDDPEEAMAKARAGRLKITSEFGWEKAAEAAVQRLNALALKPVVRFHDTLRQAPSSNKPTVSIIIRVMDDRATLKKCLQSIRRHTQTAYEIILVAYAQPAKMLKWAERSFREADDIKCIPTEDRLGWAKAINMGIEASSGSRLVILDSCSVVRENWLSDLLEAANRLPNRGIVGAVLKKSGGRSGSKRMHPISDREGDSGSWRKRVRHRRIMAPSVGKECMLMDRQLLNAIGMMDERFNDGHYGAKNLCLRAQLGGFENMIAGDVLIQLQPSTLPAGGQREAREAAKRHPFDRKWNNTDCQQSIDSRRMKVIAVNRAEDLCAQGELDRALPIMLEAIKHSSSDRRLYLKLSEMLIEGKRHADAREILMALPESVSDAKQLALLGYSEDALGRSDQASDFSERALAIDPRSSLAMNVQGIIAFKQGAPKLATEWFQKAIESDPSFGESYTNLASVKWAADLRAEALDHYERGFMLSPAIDDVATAYYSAVAETSSFERAEQAFREAVAVYPHHKRIRFLMIALLLLQDKLESAMQTIEEAMVRFGIDDGILSAGLDVRRKIGPLEINAGARKTATLSVCMIVKNEERHLIKCLTSVKPVADEIILVDTGSSDRSKSIATAFGARVFDYEWTNDFSEARNYSLSKACGDWILVLDADEVISPLDYEKMLRITRRRPATSLAYSMVSRNYTDQAGSRGWVENEGQYADDETGKGWVPSPKVRLFANRCQIRFANPVHELVEPALERLGIEVKACDVPVHHYGRLDPDKLLAKGKEYFRLGLAKIEHCKDDGKALKELAIQASEIGEYDEAVRIWKQVVALQPNDAAAHMNMGFAHLMMRQYPETISTSRKAMELDPHLREAVINYSAAEMIAGDLLTAISTLETLLEKNPNYPPAMGRLAAAYLVAGRKEEGLRSLDALKARGFDCAGALTEQAQSFIAENKVESATLLLESAIESGTANGRSNALLAECRTRLADGARLSAPVAFQNHLTGPTTESTTHAATV